VGRHLGFMVATLSLIRITPVCVGNYPPTISLHPPWAHRQILLQLLRLRAAATTSAVMALPAYLQA
jgi:hypothetical protein